MPSFIAVLSFLGTFFAGMVFEILTEYIRKFLFNKPRLKLSNVILVFDPPVSAQTLVVSAVNLSDLPIIFEAPPVMNIVYLNQEIVLIAPPLSRADTHKYPVKLLLNDPYNLSYNLLLCLRYFLKERERKYSDSTRIDPSLLRFQVFFTDSTAKRWKCENTVIPPDDLKIIERDLNRFFYDKTPAITP